MSRKDNRLKAWSSLSKAERECYTAIGFTAESWENNRKENMRGLYLNEFDGLIGYGKYGKRRYVVGSLQDRGR